MQSPHPVKDENFLLAAMMPEEREVVMPHLVPIDLQANQVLIEADEPIKQLIFPTCGFLSITTASHRMIEVGMIGPEGVSGVPVLLGVDRGPHKCVVQSPGHGFAIDVADWISLSRDMPRLRELALRFVHTLMVQTAQAAFVNGTYHIEARLARWLLMCDDRLRGPELTLTHEHLGMMLGVQRTSVTLALQTLEANRVIRARRGRVAILDREALIELADDGYGVPEAEYARLLPDLRMSSPAAVN